MGRFIAITLLLAFSGPSFAGEVDPAYFQVGSTEVSVTEEPGHGVSLELPPPMCSNKISDGLINGGVKAWKIIVDGRAVTQAENTYASAVPPGRYDNWSGVADWTGPVKHTYTYKVKNLMGMEVIKVKYQISYYYGGTEGSTAPVRGQYITNLTVRALESKALWGWKFFLEMQATDPMNVGTIREPLARFNFDLRWRTKSLLSDSGQTGYWSYILDGNGQFIDLQRAQRELTNKVAVPGGAPAPAVSWN